MWLCHIATTSQLAQASLVLLFSDNRLGHLGGTFSFLGFGFLLVTLEFSRGLPHSMGCPFLGNLVTLTPVAQTSLRTNLLVSFPGGVGWWFDLMMCEPVMIHREMYKHTRFNPGMQLL